MKVLAFLSFLVAMMLVFTTDARSLRAKRLIIGDGFGPELRVPDFLLNYWDDKIRLPIGDGIDGESEV